MAGAARSRSVGTTADPQGLMPPSVGDTFTEGPNAGAEHSRKGQLMSIDQVTRTDAEAQTALGGAYVTLGSDSFTMAGDAGTYVDTNENRQRSAIIGHYVSDGQDRRASVVGSYVGVA